MVVGAVVAGAATALFAYIFFHDPAHTSTGERIIFFLFVPVPWLAGLGVAASIATAVEYRVADGALTATRSGLFRPVVQRWTRQEILQIVSAQDCVTLLYVRGGRWMRARLSVRDENSSSNGPSMYAQERSRWLANALQQTLQIQSLPDQYEAVQHNMSKSDELSYGMAGADPPAVRILKNERGELFMEVEHCGMVRRNVPAFFMACFMSAFAIYILTLRDRHGHLIPGAILAFGLIAITCWAYVFWRSRSSTMLRAANNTLKVYRRSPLGLTLNVTLKAEDVEEIFVFGNDTIKARVSDGFDKILLTETDPATQNAIINFINDVLLPHRAGQRKAPVVRPAHAALEDWSDPPLTFKVRGEGWELLQKRGVWDQLIFVAIFALPAIALSWVWLHFHPWSLRSSILGVSTLWVLFALIFQGPICGLVLPKRITFDGTRLTYTHPTYLGLQKLQWQAWQIGSLHVNHNDGGKAAGGIRLTTRNGSNKIILMANPEQPIRRVAEIIAQSVGLEART